MPNRDLKDTNRRSVSLQLVSDAAERLWYRLITAVDDFGRLEAEPEVVFTSCFQRVPKGWTIKKVEQCLIELSTVCPAGEMPMVYIYTVGSRRYLQILSADLHIYRRAKISRYPQPPVSMQEIRDAHTCPQMPADSLDTPNSESRSSILEIPILEPRGGEPTQAQAIGRLDDFTITPELEAWSAKEGISNPGQYVEEFKDYWRSAGGKRKNGQAVKDWAAAFRNRLRMLKEQGKLKKDDWKRQFYQEEA